ncbi:MAG: energy-coupling factor transporter transmembrane protein EcfT [Actinomycetota bacterium]|nr:energy-coupling factor transporter transmembrane protein EcfT [Actinomycetota bacterium]
MIFRPRSSPLHSARAGVACVYCLALVLAALLESNPIALGAVALATAGAAAGAGVGREVGRAGRFALPFGLVIAVVNALVTRNGLTVIVRFGDLPILGHTDITLEATVAGALLGVRAAVLIMCGALYTAAVDPDQVLRAFRRISFRSALSASLATRLVPVLIRDSRRLADAQRCRPGRPPSRVALLRATTNGVLDRALDVAAALEVRGYGSGRRPPGVARAWGRHDLAFALAAAAVVATALAGGVAGLAPFTAYPSLSAPAGPGVLAVAALLLLTALAPFADRRGVGR